MTNTYEEDQPIEEKKLEEMRCIRCVLERLLMAIDKPLFVDYQLEKFSTIIKVTGKTGVGMSKAGLRLAKIVEKGLNQAEKEPPIPEELATHK